MEKQLLLSPGDFVVHKKDMTLNDGHPMQVQQVEQEMILVSLRSSDPELGIQETWFPVEDLNKVITQNS